MLQGNSSSLYPINQVAVCGSNKSISVFKTETYKVQLEVHPEFMPSSPIPIDEELCKYESEAHSISAKREENRVNKFIEGEEMGTETNPRCGGCRCGKCPVRGHTYSFQERQELRIIQKNLEYDEQNNAGASHILGFPILINSLIITMLHCPP